MGRGKKPRKTLRMNRNRVIAKIQFWMKVSRDERREHYRIVHKRRTLIYLLYLLFLAAKLSMNATCSSSSSGSARSSSSFSVLPSSFRFLRGFNIIPLSWSWLSGKIRSDLSSPPDGQRSFHPQHHSTTPLICWAFLYWPPSVKKTKTGIQMTEATASKKKGKQLKEEKEQRFEQFLSWSMLSSLSYCVYPQKFFWPFVGLSVHHIT